MFPIRILATAAVAVLWGTSAFGQGCDTPGGCGSTPLFGTGALFAANKHARMPDANHPLCATKIYPLSDWAYIRKYCGPTLNPGTCYGYYGTKWRRWEDICPPSPAVTGQPIYLETPPVMEPVPMPLPKPTPVPPKTEPMPPKTDPIPKGDFQPEIPAPMSTAPAPLPPSATISATPPVSTVEHGKITVDPSVRPPLKVLPNIVVPPVRDFPEKSRN